MAGTNMNNNERKLSPLFFILAGVLLSAMLGIAASYQLYIDKPIKFQENLLWKNVALMLIIIFVYAVGSGYLRFFPVAVNLVKALAISFIFSTPYFAALVLTTAVSIDVILIVLPGETMAIIFLFLWIIADGIAPEIGEHTTRHMIIIIILLAVTAFVMGLLKMPVMAALPLTVLSPIFYILWLLLRSKLKQKKSMEPRCDDKDDPTIE